MSNPLHWSSEFYEIEENASGFYWRLRTRDHHCIAVSPRDYPTMEALRADLKLVAVAAIIAWNVQPLWSLEVQKEKGKENGKEKP